MSSSALWEKLKPQQQAVERGLAELAGSWVNAVPHRLAEAMSYSLLAPGKRLRPILALLACELVDQPAERAIPAALALEMVHTYSLIHDDLPAMDDDDLRRGRPTCHKQFDEATAILAGDALLTEAFSILARSYSATTAAVCILELANAAGACGMVGGQIMDLAAEKGTLPVESVAELESIHRKKTGALIRASTRLGFYAAQVGDTQDTAREALDTYAECLGLAFQITDDLLDVVSTTATLGKTAGKDAAAGKLTYPGFLGVEASQQQALALAKRAEKALEPYGERSQLLRELAWFVIGRSH